MLVGVFNLSETIDIIGCDSPEKMPRASSDMLVEAASCTCFFDFRPLTSKDDSMMKFVGKIHVMLQAEGLKAQQKAQQKLRHILALYFDRLSVDELAHVDSLIALLLQTALSNSDRAHLRTLYTDLAHLLKSYQGVTFEDSSLEQPLKEFQDCKVEAEQVEAAIIANSDTVGQVPNRLQSPLHALSDLSVHDKNSRTAYLS
ncbi:hypothetical protein GH714_010865 [Hevea brasiliensis]|uniref:Uncharacterized protein n=1 Tax=Hevea brasiliensis TaxID=3981 RepID=A0A6A6MDZ5_HEVBR|nr:hypothetical protein GH714_010865 [Hevea brasiliensis]